jgi:hypothetical protein
MHVVMAIDVGGRASHPALEGPELGAELIADLFWMGQLVDARAALLKPPLLIEECEKRLVRAERLAEGENEVESGRERRDPASLRESGVRGGGVHHEGSGGDDSAFVSFDDSLHHARRETEIVGGHDETLHVPILAGLEAAFELM